MPRTLSQWPWNVRQRNRPYRERSKYADRYEQIPEDRVPKDMRWKPSLGRRDARMTVLYSMGNIYKLMRERDTGAVMYYKLKDVPEATPKEKIDAEPTRGHQVRYRKGATCWFVDAGRWFLVTVVDRIGCDRATAGEPKRITIKSVNGWDAERQTPWAYGEELEFPAEENNPLFRRLRPLKDRYH